MNNFKNFKTEQINSNLQKSISSLISNIISSLCQQIIRHERSVDIFGVVSVSIDDDTEINIKINEKFSKKESITKFTNVDCTKLIETIKKNVEKENLFEETNSNQIFTDEILKQNLVIDESKEIDCIRQKRKPRKPQQTFRHIIDDIQQSEDLTKTSSLDPIEESKIEAKTRKEINKLDIDPKKALFIDQKYENSFNTISECDKTHNSNISTLELNSATKDDEISKSNADILFKCTICERQFKRKFCLARHKKTHQNFKSYKCNVCGSAFELINQLKRHLRKIHMFNRDNLRRSCAKYYKLENNMKYKSSNFTSHNYSWPTLSTLPILTSDIPNTMSSIKSYEIIPKYATFPPFPYPSRLMIPQSSTNSNHYQDEQLFNPILPGSESCFPYSSSMYYLQNYSPILPATCPSILTNTKIGTVINNSDISKTYSQKMSLTSLSESHLRNTTLESMPLISRNSSITEFYSVES